MTKSRTFQGYTLLLRDGGWLIYPPDGGSALPGASPSLAAAKSRIAADKADTGYD